MVSLSLKRITVYAIILIAGAISSVALYLFIYSDSSSDELLVISDQPVANTIMVDKVVASNPSFLIVRKLGDTAAGAYPVPEGTHEEFEIGLSEGSVAIANIESGTYFAGLYEDSNLNGSYDDTLDKPVLNKNGNPVTVKFRVE